MSSDFFFLFWIGYCNKYNFAAYWKCYFNIQHKDRCSLYDSEHSLFMWWQQRNGNGFSMGKFHWVNSCNLLFLVSHNRRYWWWWLNSDIFRHGWNTLFCYWFFDEYCRNDIVELSFKGDLCFHYHLLISCNVRIYHIIICFLIIAGSQICSLWD